MATSAHGRTLIGVGLAAAVPAVALAAGRPDPAWSLLAWAAAVVALGAVLAGVLVLADRRSAEPDPGRILDVVLTGSGAALGAWVLRAATEGPGADPVDVLAVPVSALVAGILTAATALLAPGTAVPVRPVQVLSALALVLLVAAAAAALVVPGAVAAVAASAAVVSGIATWRHPGLGDLLADPGRVDGLAIRIWPAVVGWLAGPALLAVVAYADAPVEPWPLVAGWVVMSILAAIRLVDLTGWAAGRRAAQAEASRFRVTFDGAMTGMAVVALDGPRRGVLVEVNPALCRIYGTTPDRLIGTRLERLLAPQGEDVPERRLEDRPLVGVLDRVIAQGRVSLPAEVTLATLDGRPAWGVMSVDLVRDVGRGHAVVQVEDVTERRTARHQLSSWALQDPLTGLANRRALGDRLATARSRAHRTGHALAVLRVRLDRFPALTSSHGHEVGDAVLVETGARLRAVTRPGDTVARLGGDEFCVVLEDLTDDADAATIADRVRVALNRPFELDDLTLRSAAAIGVATGRPRSTPREGAELLDRAGFALSRARSGPCGGLVHYDDDLDALAQERAAIAEDLRRAVAEGGLRLVFQPIVALPGAGPDRPVVGWEAVLRWDRDEPVPEDFLGVAEEAGLMAPIGQRALEIALAALPVLDAAAGAVAGTPAGDALSYVSVDLGARQLAQPDLPARVARAVATAGLDPGRLCLDVPEPVLARRADHVHAVLRSLRSGGVRVTVDDFGTGDTSLAHLRHLPADLVKLDRSLVAGLGRGGPDLAVVAGLVQLAAGLGLSVVAEGVQSADQDAALQRLGAHAAQGPWYGGPQPAPWPDGEPSFALPIRARTSPPAPTRATHP
jgi:diguanylate cyclase (GGDEF)-like protein/PAS domain S-box-containing protein